VNAPTNDERTTREDHRVEAVSDGHGGHQWECSCGTSGPTVESFWATDAGAIAHVAEAYR